jgi:acyl-CoA thioesterase FadM
MLDEALGAVAYAEGIPVVVARLSVDFRMMVPLGTDATFETWVERVDGRKVATRGVLLAPDGTLLAEGQALCVMLGEGHIEKFEAARHARRSRPPKG